MFSAVVSNTGKQETVAKLFVVLLNEADTDHKSGFSMVDGSVLYERFNETHINAKHETRDRTWGKIMV